jgi:hypothetical protein
VPGYPASRYKLRKALYGLKQAHKAWHVKLVWDLFRLGFVELACKCTMRIHAQDG